MPIISSDYCNDVVYQLRDKNSNCGDSILAVFNNYRSYGINKFRGDVPNVSANTKSLEGTSTLAWMADSWRGWGWRTVSSGLLSRDPHTRIYLSQVALSQPWQVSESPRNASERGYPAAHLEVSVAVLAEILPRSPRKLFVFIIKKQV